MDKPIIDIYYCRQCNWMLRASWMAQELLHTFSEELGSVNLHPDTGGHLKFWSMVSRFGNVKPTVVSRCQSAETAGARSDRPGTRSRPHR